MHSVKIQTAAPTDPKGSITKLSHWKIKFNKPFDVGSEGYFNFGYYCL